MCLHVLGLLSLLSNQYYSDASAVCLFSPLEFLSSSNYSSCSFPCVQDHNSVIIPTPNTRLGMLRIMGRGYLEQEEVGSEHFLPVLIKLSHSVEKDPAREFTWEGACDALARYSDEEEIIDCFLFLALILEFLFEYNTFNSHDSYISQAPGMRFWILLCELDT